MDPSRGNEVDPWSHFVNVFMLDRDGNRIDRRNPQDIFTPLYNHQIPPGAGQAVHYELELPEKLDGPVTVEVKLQYRKFDEQYMEFVAASNEKLGDNRFAATSRARRIAMSCRSPRWPTIVSRSPSRAATQVPRIRHRRFPTGSAGTTTASACCSRARRSCGKRPRLSRRSRSSAAGTGR